MIVIREQGDWSRQGSSLSPGKQPLRLLLDARHMPRHYPACPSVARWLDHCYMGIDQETNERVWISEPYGIPDSAEEDFVMLRAAGFRVEVNPPGLEKRQNERVNVILVRRE